MKILLLAFGRLTTRDIIRAVTPPDSELGQQIDAKVDAADDVLELTMTEHKALVAMLDTHSFAYASQELDMICSGIRGKG